LVDRAINSRVIIFLKLFSLMGASGDKIMPRFVTERIRILLVINYAMVRAGLRMMLDSNPELVVISETGNLADALTLAARDHPDIILLDLETASDTSFDFLPDLINAAREARVVVLMNNYNPEAYQRAVCLGAMGVVLKDQNNEVLIKAIKKVHDGEAWLDRSMMASVLAHISRSNGNGSRVVDPEAVKISALTEREREVVALIGEGLRNKQIAERLFISEGTVRHHLTSIFSKLGVEDRFDLIIYAYRNGLAKPPLAALVTNQGLKPLRASSRRSL
jgi:DNA-binding NarL/FixJ family response regulator